MESFSEVVSEQDWGIGPINFSIYDCMILKQLASWILPLSFFPNTMISLEVFLWIVSNLTTYFLNYEYQNQTYIIIEAEIVPNAKAE